MSQEDKARQLTQINAYFIKQDVKAEDTGVSGGMRLTAADIDGAGSVLNFGDAEDALTVRGRALRANPHNIPLLMMQDVIHGYRTIFPVPLAMSCTFEPEIIEECAEMAAEESKYNGIDVVFSPMVDLARDARWGRVLETSGEDPYLTGVMGRAYIRGYKKGGVEACVKHFAAYGGCESGREYNTVDLSEHALKQYYLHPYRECVKEKPAAVMTSFNLLNGVPVNGHKDLLIDTLRGEWGFDGITVSDYGAVREMIEHGYCADEKECARVAANNMIDLEMMSSTYVNYLPGLVAEGKVPQKTVDNMVERVLALKEKLGLFENPDNCTSVEKSREVCVCEAHRGIARRAAAKSFVLLENDGVLPLKKSQNAAYVGGYASSHSILGAWACAGRQDEAVSISEGVERVTGRKPLTAEGCDIDLYSTDYSKIAEAVEVARSADVVVVCIGEPNHMAGEGASRSDIALPEGQMRLVREIKKLGKPIVAVVFAGRPQVLNELKELANAVLYVWQPGTEGGNAIAEVLYGDINPSGKLTMSFPRTVGQCPIYYNYYPTGRPKIPDTMENCHYNSSYRDVLNSPLYPFGYGLSYTRYEYSDFTLSSDTLKRGESVTATVKVKNAGDRDGDEVVQLYLHDMYASIVRPVKELKDFKKVHLRAGEEVKVQFTLTEESLKFYAADGNFVAEEGDFEIMVGADSERVLTKELKFVK